MTSSLISVRKVLASIALVLIVGGTALVPSVSFAQEPPPTPATPASEATTQTEETNGYPFIPLTTLPGLSEISEAGDNPSAGLSGFFNTLYRLCIGAAAIIAVIQIMRAGFKIITNKGSFSQNEEAKSLIGNTILGILLVLSPVIVFSIINPRILDLEFDFSGLSSQRENPADIQFAGRDRLLWATSSSDRAAEASRCTQSGGTIKFMCTSIDASGQQAHREVPQTQPCASGEVQTNACVDTGATASATTQNSCRERYTDFVISRSSGTQICNESAGYINVNRGCCSGIGSDPSSQCCAKPVTAANSNPASAAQPPARPRPVYGYREYIARISEPTGVRGVVQGRIGFDSKEACIAARQEFIESIASERYSTGEIVCSCDTPTSEQPRCQRGQ